MKNTNLFILASLSVALPLFFIVKFGVKPRPKPVIKLSNFEDYNKVGEVLFSSLSRDIERHQVVAVGIYNSEDLKIVDGFIEHSIKAKKFFDEVIVFTNQKALFSVPTTYMPFSSREKVLTYLDEKINFGQKVLIVIRSWDSPQFQEDSFINSLEIKDKVLSFTILRGSHDLDKLRKDCGLTGREGIKTSCIAYKQSAKLIKKTDKDKNMISAERYGLRDYVVTIIQSKTVTQNN